MKPQIVKITTEDVECLIAAKLAASLIAQSGFERSDADAVKQYHRVLTELRKSGVYGDIRDRPRPDRGVASSAPSQAIYGNTVRGKRIRHAPR